MASLTHYIKERNMGKVSCKEGWLPQSYLELILVRFCLQVLTTCGWIKHLWISLGVNDEIVHLRKKMKTVLTALRTVIRNYWQPRGDTQGPLQRPVLPHHGSAAPPPPTLGRESWGEGVDCRAPAPRGLVRHSRAQAIGAIFSRAV